MNPHTLIGQELWSDDENINHGNDITCHAVSAVLFLVFLLLNMDKKGPNFNTWGEICDSELVLEAAKVEQKIRKRTIKTSQKLEIKCYCKKQIDHNFSWSTLL